MCIIYCENTQCALVNVYHYLPAGTKEKKNEAKYKNLSKRIDFSPFPICVPVLGGSFDKASSQPAHAV